MAEKKGKKKELAEKSESIASFGSLQGTKMKVNIDKRVALEIAQLTGEVDETRPEMSTEKLEAVLEEAWKDHQETEVAAEKGEVTLQLEWRVQQKEALGTTMEERRRGKALPDPKWHANANEEKEAKRKKREEFLAQEAKKRKAEELKKAEEKEALEAEEDELEDEEESGTQQEVAQPYAEERKRQKTSPAALQNLEWRIKEQQRELKQLRSDNLWKEKKLAAANLRAKKDLEEEWEEEEEEDKYQEIPKAKKGGKSKGKGKKGNALGKGKHKGNKGISKTKKGKGKGKTHKDVEPWRRKPRWEEDEEY